ncbi:MAG: adenylyltransferase/cytidyltransferase family protein, partial [Planctomycetota bacterium]
MSLDPRHAVYAGSFDPPTAGHLDLIRRGAALFGRLTVAVGVNPDKQTLMTADERVALLEELTAGIDNVRVGSFSGLTVDFVRDEGAAVM